MITKMSFADLTPINARGQTTIGTMGSDWIIGSATEEYLYGDALKLSGLLMAANDLIHGGSGDDTIVGDADEMSSYARGGEDILDGGAGNDHIYGDTRFLLDHSRGGNDVIYGGAGRDYLYGDSSVAVGFSLCGSDEIFGGDGDDWEIVGDAALLADDATGGSDRIEGGAGNDILYGDATTMMDRARGGDDILVGGTGNDEIYGDAEIRWPGFTGVGGADRFLFDTGSGSDRIGDFETGKDLIQILPGYGFHDFDDLQGRIRDDAAGNAVIHLNGTTDQITLLGISSAALTAADFLFSDEIITGSAGNNQINPTTAVAKYRTTGLHDAIFAMDGNDVIDGGGGADLMNGGTGDDLYFVDTYSSNGITQDDDRVIELAGGGNDTVNSAVSYLLPVNVENLVLIGADAINGSGNILNNIMTGNNANNALEGKSGDDRLFGRNGDDALLGDDGNDWLSGDKGNDVLKGGNGDDWLDGGTGRDMLTGGAGADHFIFQSGDTQMNAVRLDKIMDFQGTGDVIDLDILDTVPTAPAYGEGTIATNSFDDALAQARTLMSGAQDVVVVTGTQDGWVFWDSDGLGGQPDQAIMLVGINSPGAITWTDFT